MSKDSIILLCVGLYMLLCIIVGIWAMRRTKSTKDFFMAGRDLGIMVTAFAVFSSTLSGFGFVGGPGLVYKMGMSSIWMVVAAVIGYTMTFWLLGKRLRLFAELRDSISLPDAIGARYNSKSVQFSSAIAIILGVLGYLATQILAMAIVLKDIFIETDFMASITLEQAVFISCAILVFYTVAGGIVASVYTDLIQGAMMVVAAVLIFITVVNKYDGGLLEINQIIQSDDAEAIGPWGTLGMIGCLSWLFVFGLGGSGQPHVITKLMMNRKVSDAKHIYPVSIAGYLFAALLWIGIGLVMRALVISGQHDVLTSADQAASQFLQNYAHPVLAGVVFAGLFAAIMSTADGFLNIGTAAIMHDIPKALSGEKSQRLRQRITTTFKVEKLFLWLDKIAKNDLQLARITTALLVIFSAVFALYTGDLVAILGAFGWGTFAAALVPVVGIGFNWKRATALAANVAVIASLSINFIIKIFKIPMPYGIDVGALALVVSLTLFIGISLLSKPPELDRDIDVVMSI